MGKGKKKGEDMDKKLAQIKNMFERGCLRIATVLQEDGKVLSLHHREDIIGAEVDSLLYQVSALKHQTYKIKLLTSQLQNQPLHIQGKYIGISLYDLPSNAILALVFDINSHFSELVDISNSQVLVQAKILELFNKS